MKSKKINKKVVLYSILGIGFVALAFIVHWMFLIGAVIVVYLNQKELMKHTNK